MPRGPIPIAFCDRLFAKIDRSAGPDGCWTWKGAKSRSRFRQKLVRYPSFQAGTWKQPWMVRVNRLLLVLRTGPIDVPELPGEDFVTWLRRAWPYYANRQAAHSCDNSECVNPGHLEWKTQEENLNEQWDRKRAAGGEDDNDGQTAVAALVSGEGSSGGEHYA